MLRFAWLLVPLLAVGCIPLKEPLDKPENVEPMAALVGDWYALTLKHKEPDFLYYPNSRCRVGIPQWEGKPKGLMAIGDMLGFVVTIGDTHYLHLLGDQKKGVYGYGGITADTTHEDLYKKEWLALPQEQRMYYVIPFTSHGKISTLRAYERKLEDKLYDDVGALRKQLQTHGSAILQVDASTHFSSFVHSTGVGPGLRERIPAHEKAVRTAQDAALVAYTNNLKETEAKRLAAQEKAIADAKADRLQQMQKQYAQLLVAKIDVAKRTADKFGPEQANESISERAKRRNFGDNEFVKVCKQLSMTLSEAEALLKLGAKEGWPQAMPK